MTQRRPKRPTAKDKAAAETDIEASAFGIWLNRGLHTLYDDVAKEPIPPELLRLIEEDRSK